VRSSWLVLSVPLLAVAACDDDPIDRDIEGEVTIENGVYGQLSTQQDHVGTSAHVLPDVRVTAYAGSPVTIVEMAITDDRGFFQMETGPGDFAMCTNMATPAQGTSNPGPCTIVTVRDSGNVRRDWVQNLSGGNWCDHACSKDDNIPPNNGF